MTEPKSTTKYKYVLIDRVNGRVVNEFDAETADAAAAIARSIRADWRDEWELWTRVGGGINKVTTQEAIKVAQEAIKVAQVIKTTRDSSCS